MGRLTASACLIVCLVVMGWLGLPRTAWSQYYPGVGSRIKLSDVPEGERALLLNDDPWFVQAQEISGLELEALIRLKPGLSRKCDRYVGEDGAPWIVDEQVLEPEEQPVGVAGPDQVDYTIEGQPILLGMGLPTGEDSAWVPYTIATFLPQMDGSLVELARWPAGAPYSEGLYILDLNSDGVLEVVLPWATGVAGGGGIEVVAIVPTGGLAGFGDYPEESALYSTLGACSLLDYDLDGNWEIETVVPVLANWASFYYSELMVFDPKKWQWVSGNTRFPDYYTPELSFYRQLNLAVRKFAQDPEAFRTDEFETDRGYACEIDGEWYSLDVFCLDEEGVPDQSTIDWLAQAVTAMEPETN